MRDYALTASGIQGDSLVGRFLRNWRARKAVTRLQDYDDAILRDIGVQRGDVQWAARLPLSVNAALALEECSRQRQRRLVDVD
jgi:uncharacterized protein YjiS (DUF1127 family)